MNTYTISQFSEMTGYAVKTLQGWDRSGKLKPLRTPTNRRMYTDEHLRMLRGLPKDKRKTVVYMRVSSQAQKPDLKNQRVVLEQFCATRGFAVDEWVEEVGGGLNFKRPKLLAIVADLVDGRIERLVIAHKDRLARFGFDLLTHLADLFGAEVVVLNTESLSPEQELVQDLMTITHCFSARLYGLRNYRRLLKEAITHDTGTQDQVEPNA
jgi:predicted site-specific integrase-resolvase